MPRWPLLSNLVAMLLGLPVRVAAMGSGPYPHLPYGIPAVAHPPAPMPYRSPPELLWLIPIFALFAGLLLLALQRKRNGRSGAP